MKFARRLAAAALVAAVLLGCAACSPAPAGTAAEAPAETAGPRRPVSRDPKDYVNLEVLVLYADGGAQVYAYADEAALLAGLDALEADPAAEVIQPNYAYRSTALRSSDPHIGRQWALCNDGTLVFEEVDRVPSPWYGDPFAYAGRMTVRAARGVDIGAEAAWAAYNGGERDVTVALIDTGADLSHEDLAGVFWTNPGEIPGNGVDDDGNGFVDDVNGWNFLSGTGRLFAAGEDDHGTHNAGTIAAVRDNGVGIAGTAWGGRVKIMVLKVLGGTKGQGSTFSIIQAIRYAERNGASVCNLSLGGEESDTALYRAIASSSMLFVAAAGNDGADIDRRPVYPAAYQLDNLLSVGCLRCDGMLHPCSNYGARSVDLMAPGASIFSTLPGNRYGYMTGTSMAAPMAAAAAAMVASCSASFTMRDVRNILLSTTRPLSSLRGTCATGAMLDLGAAVEAAQDFGGGAAAPEAVPETPPETLPEIPPVVAPQQPAAPGGFTDVAPGSAYAPGVAWAAELGIAKGTTATTFSPTQACTTAQILTFLWRTLGSPGSDSPCPFADVDPSSPYYTALCWAAERGLLAGEAASASTPCTRAAAVSYLWRALGSPHVSTGSTFTDVPPDAAYAAAVAWAVEMGVTNGTTPATFEPGRVCSRGQIVTFLYRTFAD